MVGQYLIPFMIHDEKIVDYRYLNGKIYLVKCKYNKDLIYAGSTKRTLEERMILHRATNEKCATSLYDVVKGDWDNWYIELYEDYPCYNKYQLERREGEVIRQIATINKNIAGRKWKEYYQDNRDNIILWHKKYYQDNRDEILEKGKKYYNNTRDKRCETSRKYHHNNKDEISEKRKEKITCNVCGSRVTKYDLKKHQRTKKCINRLNQD